MKKIILLLSLLFTYSYPYSSNVINAYAVSIYDKNFKEEDIKSKRKTNKDYQNICYTKIYVLGKLFNEDIKVEIGTSRGHIFKERSIAKNGRIIGKEIIFKHYGVSKGYIKVFTSRKTFDMKVFVK